MVTNKKVTKVCWTDTLMDFQVKEQRKYKEKEIEVGKLRKLASSLKMEKTDKLTP